MRKLLLGAAVAMSAASSAIAADTPVRAPLYKAPAEAPVAYSWTGYYVGLNAGGRIGVDVAKQNVTVTSAALGLNELLNSSNAYAPIGWLAGGQIGYNWQMSSWLVGWEIDWQATSREATVTNCSPAAANVAFFGAGANGFGYCLTTKERLDRIGEIGTARLRGGKLIRDSLWYMTGGLAWGTMRDSYAWGGSANGLIFPGGLQPGPFLPTAAAFSPTRVGWTLGAGVETRLDGGWSVKLEYLYADLGKVKEAFGIPINPAFGAAFLSGAARAATSSHVTDNIVRVGLNYKL